MAFLKIAGSYEDWNIYKKAVIICDVTELFINRALPHNSRTIDQMRQAARSCKQNIVEGATDNTVSTEMCIKLIGVARGSARELKEDYKDFLRQHELQIWSKDHTKALKARDYCRNNVDVADFVKKCKNATDETVANVMLTQISQIDAMLAFLLKKLEEEFTAEGGIKEAMSRARREHRGY